MQQELPISTSAKPALVGIVLSIFGAVMLAICIHWGYSEHRLLTQGAHAIATIVAVERNGGSYYPVFRFRDAHDRSIEVRSQTSSRRYKAGDTVPVVYDSVSPLEAEIDEGMMNYLGPVIFGGLGMLLFSVVALVWIFRNRFNADGELLFGEDSARRSGRP